jgi:hypothetical protein
VPPRAMSHMLPPPHSQKPSFRIFHTATGPLEHSYLALFLTSQHLHAKGDLKLCAKINDILLLNIIPSSIMVRQQKPL